MDRKQIRRSQYLTKALIRFFIVPGFFRIGFIAVIILFIQPARAQAPVDYKYTLAKAEEIAPLGWIRNQIQRDLEKGVIGQYDKISTTVSYNLFVKQDRINGIRYDGMMEWWSGEHEGYWKDAIIRMAYMSGNKRYMDSAKRWVNDIIKNVDASGYIGIYKSGDQSNTRFKFTGPNGELWTQSRIMMALLAYYEFTGDKKVLEAVLKAVRLTMTEYQNKNPFLTGGDGGTAHGIGYFEILEWLYRVTGDHSFIEFSKKLYTDLNKANTGINDLTPKLLQKRNHYFNDHGAHIAEGFMVPFWMAAIYNTPQYKQYAANAFYKLNYATTPSAAMRSDENVRMRKGDANELYEYCDIAEMVGPFNRIISLTGDLKLADRTEKAVFNAGQGARFPDMSALSYLTADNRIEINPKANMERRTYDCNHKAASCCVLNSGRLMPYYVEGMWMKNADESGIAAVMYGPSRYSTTLKGKPVTIEQQTHYPFGDEINFSFKLKSPQTFTFTLRKPFGASVVIPDKTDMKIDTVGALLMITKKWRNKENLKIIFDFTINRHPTYDSLSKSKEYYLTRGPLLFALPFEYSKKVIQERNNSGFFQWDIKCTSSKGWRYKIAKSPEFGFMRTGSSWEMEHPFDAPVVKIRGKFVNMDGNIVNADLVPMGNTVLRRISFPLEGKR